MLPNESKYGFRRFLTGGSCGLSLETGELNDLWFVTTQHLKNYYKPKKIKFLNNKSLNNSKFI
jgi:hypothetical protein